MVTPSFDTAATAVALCAFLGAGYTNRGRQPFARVVSKGLRYLKNVQDDEGCFGPRISWCMAHADALATRAMVEAYGQTGSPIFHGPACKGLAFLPYAWRSGGADPVVTGWTVAATWSARAVNEDAAKRGKALPLPLDEDFVVALRSWVEGMDDARGGLSTAVGLVGRLLLGEEPRASGTVTGNAALLARRLPTWDPTSGEVDLARTFFASVGLFQVGGPAWKTWNEALRDAVTPAQHLAGASCCYQGSWDPIGPGAREGGRVWSTALMAMTLEVYYRYHRVLGAR